MLAALQQQLGELYALDQQPAVHDFLITDREQAEALAADRLPPHCRETLLVADDHDGIALGLYLDVSLIDAVRAGQPLSELRAETLPAFAELLEGISHFTCAVYKASNDRHMSLFELELQAEVDKYFAALQLTLEQGERALAQELHTRLFEAATYAPTDDAAVLARYEDANAHAARYCHRIAGPSLAGAALPHEELRTFFRLPIADKVSRISALGW